MTVSEIIEVAKISQFISSNAIQKGGLFGGGEDLLIPRKLYCIRKNVERLYDLDPSDDSLFSTSQYLYALCGKYMFKARSVMNSGGSVAPVLPDDSDCTGLVIITASDFEADGITVYRADWDGKVLQIFFNNINRFILPPEWQYVAGGGFRILINGFDANGDNADCVFMVFVGCFNPGALFLPAAFPINEYIIVAAGLGATYDLSWTAYYINKYGVGAFEVYQDDGSGVFLPTGILPTADNDLSPSVYTFPTNDLRTKIIFV